MSQFPSRNPQDGYSPLPPLQPPAHLVPGYMSAGAISPSRRPTSVTAVAVIGIILGALSLICAGPSAFLNAAMLSNGGRNPIAPQLPPAEHSVIVFSVFQCIINFIMRLIMLIGCIAALGLRTWARRLLMVWSVPMILWAIVVCIATITWVGPATMKQVQQSMPAMSGSSAMTPATSSAFDTGQKIGEVIGAVFTGGLMCVVPACVLLLWRRPIVRAAFGESTPMGMPPSY